MQTNSVLPKSIQSEINEKNNKREELLKKLHDKTQRKEKPSARQLQKIEKDAKKEKRDVDNDSRVTKIMKESFIQTMRAYPGIDLANPHEILENIEEYKLKYYNFSIKLLKDNNNNQEALNNPYSNYMKLVLGL